MQLLDKDGTNYWIEWFRRQTMCRIDEFGEKYSIGSVSYPYCDNVQILIAYPVVVVTRVNT